MTSCEKCGETFAGDICTCGHVPRRLLDGPRHDLRSVVSKKTGIRYYLCTWSQGCNMPCTTMSEVAGSVLCRWHEVCRNAPDQAHNPEAFASWFSRMQEDYPSRGWWGAPAELVWPILLGINPFKEESPMLTGKSSRHMTREEFGTDLYEAIKAAAAHQQAVKNVDMYRRHGKEKQAEEEQQKVGSLYKELHGWMNKGTIPPNDVRAILARYPC